MFYDSSENPDTDWDAVHKEREEDIKTSSTYSQGQQESQEKADALYIFSKTYELGHCNQPIDSFTAEEFLKKAAELGSQKASDDLARRASELKAGADRKTLDEQQESEAGFMFCAKRGLDKAIRDEILPCVFTIKTSYGVFGTGFYQHSRWLVSNAHFLPCSEALENTILINGAPKGAPLDVARAYHRPDHEETSPDVVIVEVKSRAEGREKCLPRQFNGDAFYADTISFYVYRVRETQEYQV